jgi:hypothetical protein
MGGPTGGAGGHRGASRLTPPRQTGPVYPRRPAVESRAVQQLERKLLIASRLLLECADIAVHARADGLCDDLFALHHELDRLLPVLRKSPGRIEPLFSDRAYL